MRWSTVNVNIVKNETLKIKNKFTFLQQFRVIVNEEPTFSITITIIIT